MVFNHYAKIKNILSHHTIWYVIKIDQPTKAKNFKGQIRHFDYYYRILDKHKKPIKYCKFQQIDRFAKIMGTPVEDIMIVK